MVLIISFARSRRFYRNGCICPLVRQRSSEGEWVLTGTYCVRGHSIPVSANIKLWGLRFCEGRKVTVHALKTAKKEGGKGQKGKFIKKSKKHLTNLKCCDIIKYAD